MSGSVFKILVSRTKLNRTHRSVELRINLIRLVMFTVSDIWRFDDGFFNHKKFVFQMQAELQVLSPLVPIREVNFLRFCKQHAEGVWAVVDVSIDTIREISGTPTFLNCRRLPSGCVVQDMPNGFSKVNK